MSARNDGGPAFPVADPSWLEPRTVAESKRAAEGMTLRDYFIAHAPAEPQPWFQPVLPAPPKPVNRPTDFTESERHELQGLIEDFLDVEDCKEVRVIAYVNAENELNKALAQWTKDCDRARYIQWPAAWADAMLAARQEGGAL